MLPTCGDENTGGRRPVIAVIGRRDGDVTPPTAPVARAQEAQPSETAVPTEEADAGAGKRQAADIFAWVVDVRDFRHCLPPSEVA